MSYQQNIAFAMFSVSLLCQVLVFSQSLLSLDLIEEFLARASHETTADTVAGTYGTWIPGKDYYRLAPPPFLLSLWFTWNF
jgi:hypothetical protein